MQKKEKRKKEDFFMVYFFSPSKTVKKNSIYSASGSHFWLENWMKNLPKEIIQWTKSAECSSSRDRAFS